MISLPTALLLFLAALAAGALNSVAGGGGFIAFPALMFCGVAPVTANATQTIALWPASVAATGAYRREFTPEARRLLWPLFVTSILGAIVGAQLLLRTPQQTFLRLVPWLMLAATLMFTFSGRITAWVRLRARHEAVTHEHSHRSWKLLTGATLLQLVFSVYIGYFGAGAGILMLALFAILGLESIHTMNAFKMAMAASANGVAAITFLLAKTVAWPQALVMLMGAAIGGYLGAWGAQRMRQNHVRAFVIFIGVLLTTYFFWRLP